MASRNNGFVIVRSSKDAVLFIDPKRFYRSGEELKRNVQYRTRDIEKRLQNYHMTRRYLIRARPYPGLNKLKKKMAYVYFLYRLVW